MADSTLSNLTSLTLPSQATDLLLVGRGTARPNKVAMSDALNSAALAATTSTYGVAQLAASGGTTAGTVVQATDARLSDARNPPDGSKGDIVVSGSGSTWTIKTNPTLNGALTVTGSTTTGSFFRSSNPSAANGSEFAAFQGDIGADATHGALNITFGGLPSATGANRYAWIGAGDNSTWRKFYVGGKPAGGGQVLITATDASSSTSTGALVIGNGTSGGLGVGGSIFAGNNINSEDPQGKIQVRGTGNTTGVKEINLLRSDGGDSCTIGLTGSAYAGALAAGGLGNSEAFLYNPTPFRIFIGVNAANRFDFTSSQLKINPTTASSTTTSGALVVTGGVGIGGVINAGSGSHVFGNAAATGQLRVQRITTNPSSVTLNALVSFPNIDFGSEGGGYTFGAIRANDTEILRIYNANLAQIANVSGGGLAIGGGLRVSAQTASVGIASGAAVIAGGVGIAGDTYIGGNLVVTGTITPSGGGTSAQVDTYTTTGSVLTWTKPAGAKMVEIICIGAGGGGGGGVGGSAGTARNGGGAGGGAARREMILNAAAMPATAYVIVGTAGGAGAGGSAGSGVSGTAGGNSTVALNNTNPPTVGIIAFAGGGGGGAGGVSGVGSAGGSGGGTAGAGVTQTAGGNANLLGGAPQPFGVTTAQVSGGAGGMGRASENGGGSAEWGGGGGGGTRPAADFTAREGGDSVHGGGAGGGGRGISVGNVGQSLGDGGTSGYYGTGAAGGTNGTTGGTGTAGDDYTVTGRSGGGGGGGGAGTAGNGGTGGAGGLGGGGGGGGGGGTTVGGTGGAGGAGIVIIATYF